MSSCSVLASLSEDHFQCSLCHNTFSDPITTPCGHSFCRTCIHEHWDDSEFCHCPTCQKRFHGRPEVCTNALIAEISVQIKRRKVEACETWEVECDVCTEFKLKAMKSCLVCVTSYCEAHLEAHLRVPSLMRHKLVDPVRDLEERICVKHQRILERFCRTEQVCICQLCSESEHKDHETVTVEEEGARQKETMECKTAKIKTLIEERREKITEFTNSSEMRREKTTKEIDDSDALFKTLMSQVQEMRHKLKSNIEQKLIKSEEKDAEMIHKLNEEIAELQRKQSELEVLSQSDDHLRLLLTLQAVTNLASTKPWSSTRVYSDLCMQTARRAVGHLVNQFQAQLKALTHAEITRMKQYKESVTFDPVTAGGRLVISEWGKRLKHSKNAPAPSSADLQRFTLPMVLGTNGFTSGRHYWEVQVGLRNDWDVGVAKETVPRHGEVSVQRDHGFFSIGKTAFDYEVNCKPHIVLHLNPRPRNIGVYVDYEEGRVSFYDVNEKLHIHSFTGEHFTEKLFPYFYLYSKAKKSEPLIITSMET
ncbi:E3 ubiquitin-protein ligase TRIM39-like [Betta splendens]|uniref:E3 ubiquitin-protein ligase TRIM39-like n=1 Tax=Betta splendens TaxID=158456 RepID=A0A6P7LB87_BETSP|nr:E3 ubiquitin-protein ligase TRIM39-like [Betta splendens]XP_055363047.1 E3 ubiquitin-protein ligase TRIM39-like [Betta splendens]